MSVFLWGCCGVEGPPPQLLNTLREKDATVLQLQGQLEAARGALHQREAALERLQASVAQEGESVSGLAHSKAEEVQPGPLCAAPPCPANCLRWKVRSTHLLSVMLCCLQVRVHI